MIEILAVLDNHNQSNKNSATDGLWLSELAQFYAKAIGAGLKVDIVSTDGGKVTLNPAGLNPATLDTVTRRYYADPAFMKRLNASVSLKEIDPNKYNALYLIGGRGTNENIASNPILRNAILTIGRKGGVLSAITDGPLALPNTQDIDAQHFLTGQAPQDAPALADKVIERIEEAGKPMLPDTQHQVEVQLGNHTVHIPKGGLYDRYHMNTDLNEVAKDPRVPGVDFFQQLPKTEVESPIGRTMSPNFYYSASTARLTMLAPISALRARLPEALSPLEVMPGYGLASVVFYRYDVSDIDFYNEVAIAIAVKPANHGPIGAIDLLSSLKNQQLYAYVLALPVNTEIAQVRGHDAYGLPKWVTDIDVQIDDQHAVAQVANEKGGLDISFSAVTPKQQTFQSGQNVSSVTSYTQLKGAWHEFINQTNTLKSGRQLSPRNVELYLGEGRLADELRSLQAKKIMSLDVSTSSQIALNLPIPYYISK